MPYIQNQVGGNIKFEDLSIIPSRQGTFSSPTPPHFPTIPGLTPSGILTGRTVTQPVVESQLVGPTNIASTYQDAVVIDFAKYSDVVSDDLVRNNFAARIYLTIKQNLDFPTYAPQFFIRDIVINRTNSSTWQLNTFILTQGSIVQDTSNTGFPLGIQEDFDISAPQKYRLQVKSNAPASFSNALMSSLIYVLT